MKQPSLEGETGRSDAWVLFVGRGPRLAGLAAFLSASEPGRPVAPVDDVAELLSAPHGPGRLLLDAAEVDPEDVGILRRWLARERRSLILVGTAEERERFPGLRDRENVHCVDGRRWLERLADLARPEADPAASCAALAEPVHAARESEAASSTASRPHGPLSRPTEAAAPASPVPLGSLASGEGRAVAARLADLIQRLELSFARLREECELELERSAGCLADLERLAAFAHALGVEADRAENELGGPTRTEWPVAPAWDPARSHRDSASGEMAFPAEAGRGAVSPGSGTFDLVALVEEKLAAPRRLGSGSAHSTLDAPARILVRADRSSLAGALDTFLRLGRRCTAGQEPIGVRLSVRTGVRTPYVDVSLAWPAGPLTGLGRFELLGPAGFEAHFPDVSSGDLRRAVERVEAAGGRVDLRTDEQGLVRITLRTTLAPTITGASSGPPDPAVAAVVGLLAAGGSSRSRSR